jgi:hypothetical protein
MAPRSALLIHGMFMTPLCWEEWIPYLAKKGFDAKAPPWPLHEEAPQAQRTRHPDARLGQLTLAQVVDAIAEVTKGYAEPPALIGVTELEEMPGRTHFTLGQEGWETVADHAVAFIEKHSSAKR